METKRIGAFIAECRKALGLTQEELGAKIGVANKTVSRWETGAYLPPADALLAMSGLFGVTVNEILAGKRLTAEEYTAAAEQNLVQAVRSSSFTLKERIEFYKKKWLKEHIAAMCAWALAIAAAAVAGIALKQPLALAAVPLLLLAAHVWRYNTMMAYVERNAFDGSGR